MSRHRAPIAALIITTILITVSLTSCGRREAGDSPQTTAPVITRSPGSSVPTTVAPPVDTGATLPPPATTTSEPPGSDFVQISADFWPAALPALLIANETGTLRVTSDGTAERMMSTPTNVAVDDGHGGVIFSRLDGPHLGTYHQVVNWSPRIGITRRVMKWDDLSLVGCAEMPDRHPGPSHAMFVYDTHDVPSDTCVATLPLATLGTEGNSGEDWFACRSGSTRILAASWSGRMLAMAVGTGTGSWLEFVDAGGDPLELTFNPAPFGAGIGSADHPALIPSTNHIVYTETADGTVYLVAVNLDTGETLYRGPVAGPGTTITRVDAAAGVAVVSRVAGRADFGDALPALLVDLGTGEIGAAPLPGNATITGLPATVPVLYPPRLGAAPPDLVVTSPRDHARIEARVVTFTGRVDPGSRVIAAGSYEAEVTESGEWSIGLTLQPGGNRAGFRAIGPDDSEAATWTYVYREMPEGPDRMLGLVHRAIWADGGYGQIHDVWEVPARSLLLWAADIGWYQDDETYAVRYVANHPDVFAALDPGQLWLVRRLYEHPIDVWQVVDVVDVDVALLSWPGTCTVDASGQPAIAQQHEPGNGAGLGRAWRVDTEAGRLVEIDPAAVTCHEECGC